MRQYGKERTIRSVKGHQECLICHPETDTKVGKSKARKAAKRIIKEELEDLAG